MLTPAYKGSFKRERKLMEKRGLNIGELREVMDMIINEEILPPERRNHPLHRDYKGWWECHVEPDWLLIYRIDKEKNEVIFYRTGTHSDLF